jgi:hypothetical protein
VIALKVSWEVVAGIVPGQIQPEHTRRWHLTSDEWYGEKGLELLILRAAEAQAYASYLQVLCSQGRLVNWVRTDFVWY